MDEKAKELIAIGASVTANCHPCLRYHVEKARGLGVRDPEIAEALDVGKAVRKGAQSKTDLFASQLLPQESSAAGPKDPGCGCGS